MKRFAVGFGMISVFLVMIGCGSVGKDFDSTNVSAIRNNVTTQSEILDMFGTPFKEGKENGHTMWTYQLDKWNLFSDAESKDLVILFDDNNRVLAYRYTSNID